jgi:PAS domain S-box-containing protein
MKMEGSVGHSGTDRPELREFLAQEESKWQGVDLTLRLQYRVSRILSEAATLKEAARRTLEGICDSLGWEVGALWEADRQAFELRCVEFWHHPSLDVSAFEQTSRRMTLVRGIGLPGRVWQSGEPATIPETPNDKNFPRAASAASAGLLGAFAFPVQTRGETLGVMEFFSRKAQILDNHLLTLMAVLGNQIGQFMARQRGEESLRESEARYRLVVESAAEAIFTIDRQSTILFANSAAEKIFGYRPEELVGHPLTMLMPEHLRNVHRAGLERYLQTGQKRIRWQGMELPGLHKSGREITLEVSFGEHSSGSQHQFTGMIRDVTERKTVEDNRRGGKRGSFEGCGSRDRPVGSVPRWCSFLHPGVWRSRVRRPIRIGPQDRRFLLAELPGPELGRVQR